MPGDFGGPVCSCAPYHYFCTRDRGCTVHPVSPTPFGFEGRRFPGMTRAKTIRAAGMRRCVNWSNVIARRPCDEAIHSCFLTCCAMDCFAARAPRNDGFGLLQLNFAVIVRLG